MGQVHFCSVYLRSLASQALSRGNELKDSLNPFQPGLFEGGLAWGGVGVPAAFNSKTISDNKMKFGEIVENH